MKRRFSAAAVAGVALVMGCLLLGRPKSPEPASPVLVTGSEEPPVSSAPGPRNAAPDGGERSTSEFTPDPVPEAPPPADAPAEEPYADEIGFYADAGTSLEKRQERLQGLVDSGDEDAVEVILRIAGEDIYMNRFAVEALGGLKSAAMVDRDLPFLEEKARHDDALVASAAIRALARTGDARAGEMLLSSLAPNHERQDGYEEMVCSAIVEVAPSICGPEAAAVLAGELALSGTDGWTLEYGSKVIRALEQFGNPVAVPQLREYIARLESTRPSDPLGMGYYDRMIAEARELLRSLIR